MFRPCQPRSPLRFRSVGVGCICSNPFLAPARSRVSSRPRNGLRKIDTRLRVGVHYLSISIPIPLWNIRAGTGWLTRIRSSEFGIRNSHPSSHYRIVPGGCAAFRFRISDFGFRIFHAPDPHSGCVLLRRPSIRIRSSEFGIRNSHPSSHYRIVPGGCAAFRIQNSEFRIRG